MPTEKDTFLGNALVKNNLLTKEQLQLCWQKLQNSVNRGKPSNLAALLLVEKILSAQQLAPFLQQFASMEKTSADKKVTSSEISDHFNHYKIEKELGRGGMGVVYKALDTPVLKREISCRKN